MSSLELQTRREVELRTGSPTAVCGIPQNEELCSLTRMPGLAGQGSSVIVFDNAALLGLTRVRLRQRYQSPEFFCVCLCNLYPAQPERPRPLEAL